MSLAVLSSCALRGLSALMVRVEVHVGSGLPASEPSRTVRARVARCRARQLERQACLNAALSVEALEQHCALPEAATTLLKRAVTRWHLSARAVHRSLRVARTLANMAESDGIQEIHLAEALQYRVEVGRN